VMLQARDYALKLEVAWEAFVEQFMKIRLYTACNRSRALS